MKKLMLIIVALMLISATTNDNGDPGICICHKTGNYWVYKVVHEQSLNGHFAHGDFLYKGRPDVEEWEMDDWCNINAKEGI